MKISEVAERTGLSIPTIRFYEKSRLCPHIERGPDGKRVFSKTNADWLALLASLRATGMPMEDMRAFAELYASGDKTIPARKAALLAHRQSLVDKQAELDQCHEILEQKLERYDEIMKGLTCE
jgi:DNA-binding transcriptional MerR regulator